MYYLLAAPSYKINLHWDHQGDLIFFFFFFPSAIMVYFYVCSSLCFLLSVLTAAVLDTAIASDFKSSSHLSVLQCCIFVTD